MAGVKNRKYNGESKSRKKKTFYLLYFLYQQGTVFGLVGEPKKKYGEGTLYSRGKYASEMVLPTNGVE